MFILRNSQWEGSFLVGRELTGEKGASRREESFPVERGLPSGIGAS